MFLYERVSAESRNCSISRFLEVWFEVLTCRLSLVCRCDGGRRPGVQSPGPEQQDAVRVGHPAISHPGSGLRESTWGVQVRLLDVFSSFGPLYLLKVSPNSAPNPPGFYALIKFYSTAQASKALRQTDGQTLFQNSPLKVRLSSRQTPHFLSDSSRPLSHARCLELANHCLGFNGWTSDIITLKELTNEEEKERGEEDDEGGGRWRRLKFGCVLQLSFPHHGQTTRAAAVVEDSFTCSGEDGFTLHHSHSADAVIQRDLQ
ncbi:RAD52 motif-containing protein 1-like isoform X2 [Anarrhichthys ocellatus]|uniref:RAD52 motif-containing protein 1-like isoform X2 n=1 Tax=Anarrhichthys ocellatus TaxID=433405 RepID=UPI0012ED8F24|nr:RAD52 motif-containing protein 1-like isoform X2 [Anarrhichthys ocellatus]